MDNNKQFTHFFSVLSGSVDKPVDKLTSLWSSGYRADLCQIVLNEYII